MQSQKELAEEKALVNKLRTYYRAKPTTAEEAKRATEQSLQIENAQLKKELDEYRSARLALASCESALMIGSCLGCRMRVENLKKVTELQEASIRSASKLPQQVCKRVIAPIADSMCWPCRIR